MSDQWRNWAQVEKYIPAGRTIFRSSAPNYKNQDSDQRLTRPAVDYLVSKGVRMIISLNHQVYSDADMDLLNEHKIAYRHFPVVDYDAPTFETMRDGIVGAFSSTTDPTLVHCGFGEGRTGMAITAYQLSLTRGVSPDETVWKKENLVERKPQMVLLRRCRDFYKQ